MRNSIAKSIYHSLLVQYFDIKRFRGGWMLTQMFVNDWKKYGKKHPLAVAKAHVNGWSLSDWRILGITNENKNSYLSTKEYCSLHPFTGNESSWIDDKLTLKYILHSTLLSDYMPKYYFQVDSAEKILRLMDAPENTPATVEGVLKLLDIEGALAFKKIKASLGEGFYKVEKSGDDYCINERIVKEEELKRFIGSLSGYLVLELLKPHPMFAKYSTRSVGCLRYIIGRKLDGSLIDVYSFMRIGTMKSGSVENFNAGGVLVIVDENGNFDSGYILEEENVKSKRIAVHPDNGVPLTGAIPNWKEVKTVSHNLANLLPQLNYMGIDYVITENGQLKILEINSLSSLDAIQLDKSIYETQGGEFFKERLGK